MKNALIIDDCIDFQEIFSLLLLEQEFAVWQAHSTEEAFQTLHEETFDIIFCDLHLPFTLGDQSTEYLYTEEVGLRTIEELRWVYPEMPIVAMSAAPDIDFVKAHTRLEGIRTLAKPLTTEDIKVVLQEAFEYIPPFEIAPLSGLAPHCGGNN